MTCRLRFGFILAALWLASGVHAQTWQPANPGYHPGFPVLLPAGDGYVRSGSIALGDVSGDGRSEILVGTSAGVLEVYTSGGTRLWSYRTGGAAIESKPLVADLNGDGHNKVVFSAGSTFTNNPPNGPNQPGGGVYILDGQGNLICSHSVPNGVYSSPAAASLDPTNPAQQQVVFGTWDLHITAMRGDCSVYWDKSLNQKVVDTVWSSPAIGDLLGDGRLEVVIGGDSQNNPNYGTTAGGVLHAFLGDGSGELPGFPIFTDEVIYSSPALANLDPAHPNQLDIVVGTGDCWDYIPCAGSLKNTHPVTKAIYAFAPNGQALPGWPFHLPETVLSSPQNNYIETGQYAFASPAIADLDGNGKPSIIVNTIDTATDNFHSGWMHVLNADGSERAGWPKQPSTPSDCSGGVVHAGTTSSPIAAVLTGSGLPDIVVPSNGELVVWDGNGNQLSRTTINCPNPAATPGLQLLGNGTMGGAAAVGDLTGNGTLTLVTGGIGDNSGDGAIYAWDFGVPVDPSLAAWPAFRNSTNNRAVWRPDGIFKNGFE